jgi:hypothetical protein
MLQIPGRTGSLGPHRESNEKENLDPDDGDVDQESYCESDGDDGDNRGYEFEMNHNSVESPIASQAYHG